MNDRCSRCGTETELYENGVPVCVKCASAADPKKRPIDYIGSSRREQITTVQGVGPHAFTLKIAERRKCR
jgi:hypothetical protein